MARLLSTHDVQPDLLEAVHVFSDVRLGHTGLGAKAVTDQMSGGPGRGAESSKHVFNYRGVPLTG